MQLLRRPAPDLLAALFGASSLVHLIRPQVFEPLIPGWLPNVRGIVYVSGIVELICAVGLLRRWRWAPAASALLLVAVFPGNVQMAVNSLHDSHGKLDGAVLLALVRLPLQVPLIWAALQATNTADSPRSKCTALVSPHPLEAPVIPEH